MADSELQGIESMEGVEPATVPAVETMAKNQPETDAETPAVVEDSAAMDAKNDQAEAQPEAGKAPAAEEGMAIATEEKDGSAEAQPETAELAPAAAEPPTPKITIVVKTPKDQKTVNVDPLAGIKELKEETAKEFGVLVEQLCFIYSGKILQDEDQLSVYGIEDGSTVHLVIKSVPYQVETKAAHPTDNVSAGGAAANVPKSFNPLDFAALGVDRLNYSQLQQQMQRQLTSNPELIRQMIQNPLVQQLMANPSVITSLMTSNPQSKEWLQRNTELADMLKSQEVMQQTLEISQNPELLNEMIAAQGKGRQQYGASAMPSASGQHKYGASTSLPELHTMWQQLAQKPQLLQQMYNMPYTKSLLDGFAANPQIAQQMIGNHPLFAESPALQQQWQQMMPQFLHQMQSPTTQSMMTNPKALQAMMKIQQGMDILHSEAPGLVKSTGLSYLSLPPPAFMPPPVSDAHQADAGVSTNQSDTLSNVMSQMIQQMATGQINLSPEERFKDQLEQLASMGFTDQQANLNVLVRTFGDMVSTVEQLQQQQSTT